MTTRANDWPDRLFETLKAMRLVPQDFRPDLPGVAELHRLLQGFQDRRGEPFRILGKSEVHPEAIVEAA